MSVDVAAVLTAIKTRLATISVETRDVVPEMPITPMAVPALGPIQFDEGMGRGSDLYEFSVLVFIDRADAETATNNLVQYANASGSKSIKAAIEGGTPRHTLGGVVSACKVTEMKEPNVAIFGEVGFLFLEFTLEVHG